MSELFFVVKGLTLLASVALACVLVARDPGLRINRLMAIVPSLLALWSLGELAWNLQPDAAAAEALIRANAGTWMFLGPAALHIFSELAGARRPIARRLVPVSYLASGIMYFAHCATGWGLVAVYPVPWGFGFRLDAGFLALYATMAVPTAYVMIESGKILPRWSTPGDRRVWNTLYVFVALALVFAMLTDLVLPALGVLVPPFGTTSILLVSFCVAFQFKRYGYSLMAPSTFASEILEALGDGVVLLRANGEIRIANGTFERLVGARDSEVRNVPFAHFARSLEVDPRSMTEDIECDLVSQSGESIPVLITPTRLQNPSGNTRGAALVIRDLREVSALRGSLVASDRLATVGGLSASIAEEIREPIQEMRSHLEGIRSRLVPLQAILSHCAKSEELDSLLVDREELLEECLEGLVRIEAIMRDVRGFASNPSGRLERVDLNALIGDAVRIATARTGEGIAIERRFEDLTPVPCVKGEIEQVLVNLLVNAIYATGGHGRVQLSTWQHEHEVWICIEDDGCGIPREVMARIFDPFFTTKPVGDGTGLGLAISHHIVRNHGGDLRVESEARRGSRFTLALPLDPNLPCSPGAVSAVTSR